MKSTLFLFLFFAFSCLEMIKIVEASQCDSLDRLIFSKRYKYPSNSHSWPELNEDSEVHIESQVGQMQADKIVYLPGQPDGVDFDQYSGYVTVNPKTGRSLFYYFVESSQSSTKPLLLWLNGGPGCSSLGYGAMEELGPFRVNGDGKTLFRNNYAWNNVANVIFLESPAGVGFSYSKMPSDYDRAGDKSSAHDSYVFLVNWLERFPQYKSRDFFIAGESYAGHYAPQLAHKIMNNNNITNAAFINLKGIAVRFNYNKAKCIEIPELGNFDRMPSSTCTSFPLIATCQLLIGNAVIDDFSYLIGVYDYLWSHALISDETMAAINKQCSSENYTDECNEYTSQARIERGPIDIYNIYGPRCHDFTLNGSNASIGFFDPCSDNYVTSYLNLPEVQTAFHANPTNWSFCRYLNWTDRPNTILPIIKNLIANDISVWIYSGDTDGKLPVTSTKNSLNKMKLGIKTPWHPWFSNNEVGGYAVAYEGLTFVTVRGAGHQVPSYQPERALVMISSFLNGILPPPISP